MTTKWQDKEAYALEATVGNWLNAPEEAVVSAEGRID